MKRHASINRVYRLLWSAAIGAWIAAAETARKRGKSAAARTILASILLLSAPLAYAAPGGGQVIAGSGTISVSGLTTTIRQTTPNLSLDWKSFNIGSQETVDFLQPSAASIAINRILGTSGTQILGHLDANGQIYLINPNGILFGKGAQVNIGGLVASTLDVSDLNITGGARTFSGDSPAGVVNAGTISASNGGYVALVGNHVGNQGVISAQLGTVALAAGSATTLTFAGNSLLHMQVEQSVVNSAAENGGLIRADGGQVIMTAGAKKTLLASVVNNSGVIQAHTMENQHGTIVLLAGMQAGRVNVDGTLDASSTSGHGGQIVASADDVRVGEGASVDASGATGGGTIAVGGGWQGGGGAGQATSVYVAKTATLNASATNDGNGGTVSVRSDVDNPHSTTRSYGTLLARGGPNGGNGGDIETSGHWLDVSGITVDASARRGVAGEWLLDPYNVVIAATTAGTAYASPFVPTQDSTILASTIGTALTAGNNVTITTGTSGASIGDITVNSPITKTAGANVTLTLQAADSVIVNQPITNSSTTGKLNVDLWADNDNGTHDGVGVVILDNSITTAGGAIAFGTGATLTLNAGTNNATTFLVGGDVYVGGTSAVNLTTAGGSINVNGQLIIANRNGLNFNTANGNVNFAGLVDSGDSYAFVTSTGISWTGARTAAKSGLGANVGDTYLATITSRLENAVAGSAAGYVASWLGAERVTGINTDAVWRWVTGPEGLQNGGLGLPFFTQNGTETGNDNGTDKGGTAIGTAYTNWNPTTPEPNNSGGMNLSAGGLSEYVMQFVGTLGQWNDLPPTSLLTGYVMETNLAASPLNVNAGTGTVTFATALGSNKPLASLNVSAHTIALPTGAVVNTAGAQTYAGQVTVGGSNVNLLTVSPNNLTTTYGTAVPAPTVTYSGFINNNTVASLTTPASVTVTGLTAQPGSGSYPIIASGVVDSNYYIVYNPGTLIVNPATLTITANNATKTYNQPNPALTVGYSGFEYADTIASLTTAATATTTALMGSNAGAYPITAAGAVPSANYTAAYVAGTLTVNPITLTVSGLTGTGRAYNGTTVDALAGSAVVSGLVAGQTFTLGSLNATLASAAPGSEALTADLMQAGGSAQAVNYQLTQPTLANVTITPAVLTVAGAAAGNKVYNGTTAATLTGTLTGVFGSDAVTLVPSGTFASKNVANGIAVTATDTLTGGAAVDYTLTEPAGLTANITPLAITVSATATNKVYDGGLNAAASLSSAGVIAGDTVNFTYTSAAFSDKNVGTAKPVLVGGISDAGAQAVDYTVSNPTASTTANITQLASVLWTGPATGGSWSNPANWAGGAIPDLSNVASVVIPAGDNVIFNASVAGPVNISQLGSGGLTVDSGILNVATALNLSSFAQSGGTVGGTGSFTVTNAFSQSAGQIALTGGAVNINQAAGNLTFANIAAGSVALSSPAGAVALGNLTTSGDLAVTAQGGSLTQAAGTTLTVDGASGLSASNAGVPADIDLSNAGNTFGQAVSASGLQVSLSDSGPLTLGTVDATGDLLVNSTGALNLGSSTVGGTLVANSGNGNVTQSGPLSVTGTTDIVAGSGNVQLNNAGNTLLQPVSASGAQIALTDAAAMTLGTVAASGNLLLTATGALDLGSSSVGGNLVANSGNGNVTQDGPLAVTGTSDIIAGTGNILLTNLDNTLTAAISASGGAVTLTDGVPMSLGIVDASGNLLVNSNGALNLGSSTVGGTLVANSANGNVTQSGPLAVTGTSDITAGTGNIHLTNADNTLVAAVSASGAAVSLTDDVPLTLGLVDASGNLLVTSNGALDLGDTTVGGNLAANSSSGGVTQGGPLAVAGTTDITAGSGNILLTNLDNTLTAAISASGAAVSLTDAVPMTLGTVDASGNLLVNSNGALNLGSSTVGGTLAANSVNGNVTQDGPLAVTGTSDITAGTGSIALTNADNTLVAAVSASGAQISVTDAVPLILGLVDTSGNLLVNSTGGLDLGSSTVGGTLVANSGNGNVTQDGPLSVTGTTDIMAGTGNVQLNNAGNALLDTVSTSGGAVSLTNAAPLGLGSVNAGGNLLVNSNGALDLGNSTVGGNLVANSSNGNVTQDGPLLVGGTTDIVAGTGSIQLTNSGNVFQGQVSTLGTDVGVGGEVDTDAVGGSISNAVAQVESDILWSDPDNPPDALNLSPTVSESRDGEMVLVTMSIGARGPRLHIMNGGIRMPGSSAGASGEQN